MSKMFVHYSGNKAAFAAAKNAEGKLFSEIYKNHIVFIKGEAGECIYTHGAYYGDVKAAITALENRMGTAEGKIQANDDAIKALKYFSQIKVGDTVAAAANKEGTITFSAVDPQEVTIDVDARGISFGLSEAFKTKVDTAASQAAAAAVKSEVTASIQALEAADSGLSGRISALETAVGSGEEGNSLAARMATAESDIDALEGRVKINEDALVIIKGEGEGSVKKAVADGIAEVVAGAHADFDTLKEVADWIQNDTIGATEMQNTIARLDGADTLEGSVKKQIKDAVAIETGRAEGQEAAIRSEFAEADTALKTNLEGQITAAVEGVNKTIKDNELVISSALNDLNTRII
jgi:hypothetical protein